MIKIFFVQYFGSAILVLAGVAALMGHLEKAIWSNKDYSKKNPEAILVNTIGILIIFFISGVTFLVSKFSKEDHKVSAQWASRWTKLLENQIPQTRSASGGDDWLAGG